MFHGGRLVLVKSVLESILFYWLPIAHTLNAILNKIRKKNFIFLSIGKREMEGLPLVKWLRTPKPKEEGGGV